jgi:hypothetical protein
MAEVEAGAIPAPAAASPALVVYLRAIELAQGDVMTLVLKAPDGAVIVQDRRPPLDHDKAQVLSLVGRKRPAAGWPRGRYSAILQVIRGGKPVIERRAAIVL